MATFFAQVALGEGLLRVGQLRFTQAAARQHSTFAYDADWTEDPRGFPIQPDMPLGGGPFHHAGEPGAMREALAGSFSDAGIARLAERAPRKRLTDREVSRAIRFKFSPILPLGKFGLFPGALQAISARSGRLP